jgi:hypothetical protein
MKKMALFVLSFSMFCMAGCYSDPYQSEQNRYSLADGVQDRFDWVEVESFLEVYNPENAFSFCNGMLEKYYNQKEDMSGWEEVTNCVEEKKSKLSNCEDHLRRISLNIDKLAWESLSYIIIKDHVARKPEMLNKVAQARAALSAIRSVIPTFENRMNTVKQDKENELRNRKNEIDSLKQSGNNQLTYSEPDVRIELTDLFVNRERLLPATISSTKSDVWSVQCCVKLTLTVISKNKIVRPRTGRIYSSEQAYSSEHNPDVIIVNPIVSQVPTGVEMEDNFGNHFGLIGISPLCEGGETDMSLKPDESKDFKIIFHDAPLKNTESLTVKVSTGTFGNNKPFEITISKNIINTVLKEIP